MSSFKRSVRIADQLQRELAAILLRKIKDPRLESLTVSGVKVTDDLRLARIYYVLRGDESDREEALKALNRAKGFIRREIGQTLKVKYVPDIEFFYDNSFDYAERIENLIQKIHDEHED